MNEKLCRQDLRSFINQFINELKIINYHKIRKINFFAISKLYLNIYLHSPKAQFQNGLKV